MIKAIQHLLESIDIQPILVDIGASGAPPKIWEKIARHSFYIGFDPDRREIHEIDKGFFRRSIIVNKAVSACAEPKEITFHLTSSPYCSSMLEPDEASLSNYFFSDLFQVERQTCVEATTLDKVIEDFSLPCIDWFKTDSQGTDLSLFNSLNAVTRSHVLAVDLEPGLIDAYKGEDLFIDIQRDLLRQGFWLSDLNLCGAVRLRRSNLGRACALNKRISPGVVNRSVRTSPGWCEIRYLRTLEWMEQNGFSRREYALLWIISLLDNQPGFAFDLAVEYERIFGGGDISQIMQETPLAVIEKSDRGWRQRLSRVRQSLRF